MSLLIQSFADISREDAETAGGKGASLGEMTNAGIPVPQGFVVLAGAFEQFLAETDLNVEIDTILHCVDIEKMHTVEHASETIQKLILEAKMSEDIEQEIREQFRVLGSAYVAVRSIATAEDSSSAAWAGQLDTFLNTTEETFLENVQKCWASLFTPRAIFYRFEKGLHASKISVAVVVQKMVQSEISGIAFSVHPVTEDRNQLIIEAGYGLGEAIVSGQITPDSYVVEKEPRRILDKNITEQERGIYRTSLVIPVKTGIQNSEVSANEWQDIEITKRNNQKLSDEQILELAELIIKIENHYGFPCDIEWALEACPNAEGGRSGKFYIVQSRPITTLAEMKPESISKNQGSIFNPQDYLSLGRWVAPTLAVVPWMRWSEGKIFKDLAISIENPNHVHIGGYSLWPISLKAAIEQAFLSDIESGRFMLVQKYLSYAQIELETFLEYTTKVKNFDDANATIALRDFFSAYEKVIPAWLIAFFLGPIVEGRLRTVVDRYSLNADTVLSAITSERRTFSQLARQELWEIKKKIISYGLFEFVECKKYNELLQNREVKDALYWYVQKWEWIETHHVSGDPLTLEKVLDELRDLKDEQSKEDISTYPEELQKLLEIAGDLAWLRLQSAETSAMVSFAARPLIRFLGEKIGLSYDEVIWLTAEEIINFVETGAVADKQELSERIKAWGGYRSADTVLKVLTGEELERVLGPLIPKHNLDVHELKGTVGYKGKVTGRARVMLTSRSDKAFVDGEILIASETTPDYVSIMKRALAFVTDQGGITSHAAIISRELQKPCIVGTKIATQVLHDGDLVEVDAEEGVVRILESNKEAHEDDQTAQILTKVYERDIPLILEDLWALTLSQDCEEAFGETNPYQPMILLYVTEENCQIWENEKGLRWFQDQLLKKNEEGGEFIEKKMAEYKDALAKVVSFWEEGPAVDKSKLERYKEHLAKGLGLFSYWYYTGTDERTPSALRKQALELRQRDEFFARNTVFIKDCCEALGCPREWAGLVTSDEFPRLPSKEELARRASGMVAFQGEYFNQDLQSFAHEHPEMMFRDLVVQIAETNVIKGEVAHRGVAQGKVIILKNEAGLSRVQPGDIHP
jgi:phosphoenolpyruvate synthase/pyruvate phosphate dikinase